MFKVDFSAELRVCLFFFFVIEGSFITIPHASTIFMLLPQIFKGSILCFYSGLCALLWTTTSTPMRQERTHSDAYEQRVLSTNTWGVFIVVACCSRVSTSLTPRNSRESEVGRNGGITFTAGSGEMMRAIPAEQRRV